MRLPNPERAIVDIAKLADYCLSLEHEVGKHKARVFRSALGITQTDARWLQSKLFEAVHLDAIHTGHFGFGELYVIDFELKCHNRAATARSGWIVRTGEDFPRLTTCYLLLKIRAISGFSTQSL